MTRYESKYADQGTLARGIDPKTMRPYPKGEAPWEKEIAASVAKRAADQAVMDALAPVADEVTDDPDGEITVLDKGGADRIARRVLAIRSELAADEQLAQVELDAIEETAAPVREWIGGRRNAAKSKEDHLLLSLYAWHAEQRSVDHKGRAVNATIPLPSGARLVSRQGQTGVEVHDKDAFIEWANADDGIGQGLLRRIPAKVEPDLAAIKQHLIPGSDAGEPGPWITADREVVPGLIAQPAKVTFTFDDKAVDR